MKENQRLYTLDAMRGVAAILVLFFHMDRPWGYSGYLAVDFFFMLSGFVLARTYESRFAAGLTAKQFIAFRIIRLYPLYLLGVAIGFVAIALKLAPTIANDGQVGWSLLAVALVPSPLPGSLFPMNIALWSVFNELWVNVLFATTLARLSTRRLLWLLAASGACLAAVSAHFRGLGVGSEWDSAIPGSIRTVFAFTIGIVLARQYKKPATQSWLALVFVAGLIAVLEFRHPGAAYDLLVAAVAAPLLLWAGASVSPPRVLQTACEFLGDMSFALYAIHFPLYWIVSRGAQADHLPNFIWRPAFVIGTVALAWCVHRYFDLPVRAKIVGALRRGRDDMAARGAR